MKSLATCEVLRRKWHLICLFTVFLPAQVNATQSLPVGFYENQNDFSYMWWKSTIKEGNTTFAIRTSKYALSFNFPKLAIESFTPLKSEKPANSALYETNSESFPENLPCDLRFGLETDGVMSWCESTSGDIDDCQLIETGKYFQRRFINNLPDLKDCDPYASGLEISSWPDRIAYILKVTPARDLKNVGMAMSLEFPSEYNVLLKQGDVMALKNSSDGSGFIILKSEDATNLTVVGNTVRIRMANREKCPTGEELNSGMIIYPVSGNIDSRLVEIAEQEQQPLVVAARQILPLKKSLNVVYDKDHGWHQIHLRSDATSTDAPVADESESNPDPQSYELNNRMERVQFSVSNPSSHDKVLRLNFAKGRLVPDGANVFAVTGISAVFRDTDGNPVGIPIQLSKNWHSGGRTGKIQYFRGTWYHGLSMLTIPAKASVTLEYTSVNALWGGIPAASHAQLCLVGWGSNQQWDQSAIGAWGESITYEPDLDQAKAPVLDFRPLMVRSETGKMWGWTGNMGGADFFNLTKLDGERAWHSRMRTHYRRYSPNLTEVTYAGTMNDGDMEFEYTTSVGRSDDMTRGIYKIKLRVNEDTSFKDFVIFQAGAETYHYVKSNTLAWGNEAGLKDQWSATIGTTDRYVTSKQVAEGKIPWFSFADSAFSPPSQKFIPADRGFVIRKWKARINGRDNTPPWFAEFNATTGHGESSGLINITPPDGCNSLNAGDYIEADIVLFTLPSKAEEYYGPNQNFQNALQQFANSWEMTYREAVGNNLIVSVSSGKLLDVYPIKIEAAKGTAQFSVTGGLSYVALTITNVGNYQNPHLFQKVNGEWQKIDQGVFGNDFWQSEYDAATGTWDITYNLNLDTPDDVRRTVQFKFVGG